MDQPDPTAARPAAEMAQRLRDLRIRAGNPSITRLAALAELQGSDRAMGRSTIQDKLRGASFPRLEQLLALVTACAKHAVSINAPLPPADVDETRWRDDWSATKGATQGDPSPSGGAGKLQQVEERADSSIILPSIPSQTTAKEAATATKNLPSKQEFVDSFKHVVVTYTSSKDHYEVTGDVYSRDLRESFQGRAHKKQHSLIGELSAILAREFGPKDVRPHYSSGVRFSGGTIESKLHSDDAFDLGDVGSFWLEVSIAVEFHQLDALQLIREKMARNGFKVTGSAYHFSKQLDLGDVAEMLHERGIHLREWTGSEIVLDAEVEFDKLKARIAIRQDYKDDLEIHLLDFEVTSENARAVFEEALTYAGPECHN